MSAIVLAGVLLGQLYNMANGEVGGLLVSDEVRKVGVEPLVEFHQVWQEHATTLQATPLHGELGQETELASL